MVRFIDRSIGIEMPSPGAKYKYFKSKKQFQIKYTSKFVL